MTKRDPFSLKGKLAVVTGGSGLLGLRIAQALRDAGARVIILDLLKPKTTLKKVVFERWDIADHKGLRAAIDRLEKKHGPVDIWINNAYPRTPDWGIKLEDIPAESWRKNIDTHLNAYCLCGREAAMRMAKRRKGAVINMASVYGLVGPDFSIYEGTKMTCPAAYAAIKGGIIAFTKYLASYFKNKGVRVNAVCPGGVFNHQDKLFLRKYSEKTLLGRLARPDEIAWPVVFLASDAASYITGSVLVVDGGWTCI